MSLYCSACHGCGITELVPWSSSSSSEGMCLGCAAATWELVKLPALDPALPMHRSTRTARLADVTSVYFGGNADMARGWRDAAAAGQVSDPALYARQMRPFYALLLK